ncbi:MAG: tail fiber domain-containing protein, partial [Candidatus Gastranaerophilales bacterium]|nr:tail fiber domain-containing protein [Candidatus Gastranaerophilales bacterium]
GGEDLVMTYNDDGSMGATVGPYKVIGHRVGGAAYKDNRKYCMNGNFNSGGGWCTSDIRLKDVGETFNGGLEELNKLKFYNFTFKNDNDKQPHVGVMAQELEQVFPNAVKKDKDGWLQIRWDEMFYSAINAIKELNAKVIAIAEKLQDISKDITDLKTKTEKQQSEIDNQAKLITTQQQELEKLSERIEKLEHNK